jgi:crotonobetainyl-CoA:carnitine CoA-transferase CaiB-like acyl-CoA transferase
VSPEGPAENSPGREAGVKVRPKKSAEGSLECGCRTPEKAEVKGLLRNLVVLDLANEDASFCSKLLADLGATVVKIEEPEGDPARRAEDGGASFFYNNINKLGVVLDLRAAEGKRSFLGLIRRADVLVESFHPGTLESKGLGTRRLSRLNPRLIHISIAGFGQAGPKRTCRFCYTASLFGANAVLLGLRKRKVTGKGCHLDLSAQEAVASAPDNPVPGNVRDQENHRRHFSVLRCAEGYIQIPILRDWDTLVGLLDREGKAGDLLEQKWQEESYREMHRGHILELVERWTRSHGRRELFELGQTMGFPWAPIESFRDVLRSPQLKARRFFVPVMVQERTISTPGLPYKFSSFSPPLPKPAPLPGEHNEKVLLNRGAGLKDKSMQREEVDAIVSEENREILKGVRVLDLTRMISGPYATRILADSGAEVIKIQSRFTARGAEKNDTPSFSKWNRNKRSVTLNLGKSEARGLFLELVAISDIVVENFSPRVMSNWDLDYEHLRAVKPDLIMASISAMGHTGPWKNFVGFAPTFHALSGLTFASSHPLDVPADLGQPYGDVVAGLYASLAILASIEHRNASGKGQYIDLSAYEALCTVVGPALIKAANAGEEAGAPGLSTGCYQCILSDRSPWTDTPANRKTAPSLGEANRYVFRELLGHSEADFDSFVDRGVID